MKNIDLKGIFVGGFLGLLGVFVIAVISTFIKIMLFGSQPYNAPYTTEELVILVFACAFSYLWSGFIISKISRKGKLLNPIIVSLIILVLALFPAREVPFWYILLSGFLAPPLFYYGANFHLRRLARCSSKEVVNGAA
ncbi:hypothetical protein ACJJIE_10815 [Microbulbifer sp. TRSA001]|uniref:hypothetical protein n=1 Tax=Microbulbifer sp. TRSA001 TaxID=3243381 RepID=UPI00403959FB